MQAAPPTWKFVPADLDAGDVGALEPLFDDLLNREVPDVDALEKWLEDESELFARIGAEKARRYIRKTCHTDDEEAQERYLDMERNVQPRVKVLGDQLDGKFLALPARADLPPERYAVLQRSRQNDKEIFRPENTELQAEDAALQTRQQSLMGSLVVQFQGAEHTPQQMTPFLMEQDREVRRTAFEATLEARRSTWEPLNEIYDAQIALRDKMGRNAGFDGYTPFRFRQLHRFDYGPDTCERFHEAVEHAVVPAVARLNARRREALGVDTLRGYDLDVDLDGRPAFRPFATEAELIELTKAIFAAVDPRFAASFEVLEEQGLLDLMSRPGKAPGGYQYNLEDIRLPFIFCNSVGVHDDVQTLLHEGGHSFHSVLSRNDPLVSYRHAPIEFAETASMSMELMGLEELAIVYGEEEARLTRRRHLEGLLRILPWIASIDAFQHWIYAHPGHDRDARQDAWLRIMDRFSPGPDQGGIDFSGYEDARAQRWTQQGHLYGHPFYYIEYGIAQIAALQVWQAYRRDKSTAVQAYRDGLSLGGSKPLPELFAATGVTFDVSTEMLSSLVADVEAVMAG